LTRDLVAALHPNREWISRRFLLRVTPKDDLFLRIATKGIDDVAIVDGSSQQKREKRDQEPGFC